jgi:RNA-binding protein NOB1
MVADDDSAKTSDDVNVYRALVVDSGPIIRLTGLSSDFRRAARSYYTVPAVLGEIRDAKARLHLEQLPFSLITREASPDGIKAVVDFARQTGDYASLSAVDLQVLGLLYDLEREGCHGGMDHVRTAPKRTLGVGRIESLLARGDEKEKDKDKELVVDDDAEDLEVNGTDFFTSKPIEQQQQQQQKSATVQSEKVAPKSWAALVHPSASQSVTTDAEEKVADNVLHVRFGSMNVSESGGQFSDADEEDDTSSDDDDTSSDDEDGYADSDKEISDEECDVYILDPEEVEERKLASSTQSFVNEELHSDFPSLKVSLQIPYEGSDNEDNAVLNPAIVAKQEAEKRKQEALRPVTKSGKLYNSFRKYGDLFKPHGKKDKSNDAPALMETPHEASDSNGEEEKEFGDEKKDNQSRIIGGMLMSGQGTEVDDDGEGWITSPVDIRKMKAAGRLNPSLNPGDLDDEAAEKTQAGPPISQRAACTTTDFAMQNVILQMNLELLSVDGIKVRRLKSWVTRCGACFTVFANGDAVGPVNTKRMFCSRCGSDLLQRVAASVDGKTGRLRLHLSKKYKASLRGTKYSLPKPGTVSRMSHLGSYPLPDTCTNMELLCNC